jgi:hypothetical protein
VGVRRVCRRGASNLQRSKKPCDRIVVATVLGADGETVRLPDGGELVLGFKIRNQTGLHVSYRVRIAACLFTRSRPATGDSEVVVPGGTVYESVDGASRLRTWRSRGGRRTLAPTGEDVPLF